MGGAEFQVAVVQMWWEHLDEAKASFEQMLAVADEIGDESSVPYIRVLLAQTECLRGRFDAAAAHADEGALRGEQVGQATVVAYSLALRALADAYRGDEDAARTTAARALALAGGTAGRPAEHFATAALGLLELSLGRNAEAVSVLAPLVAFARQQELREPGVSRFVPDLVEALVAGEQPDEAEEQLAWFEANAARLERPSGQAASARCRGLLAAGRGDLAGALASSSARSSCTTAPRSRSTAPARCLRSASPAGAPTSVAKRGRRSSRRGRSSSRSAPRSGSGVRPRS